MTNALYRAARTPFSPPKSLGRDLEQADLRPVFAKAAQAENFNPESSERKPFGKDLVRPAI